MSNTNQTTDGNTTHREVQAPPAVSVSTQDGLSTITGGTANAPASAVAQGNATGQNAPPRTAPTLDVPTGTTKLQATAADLVARFVVSENYMNYKPRFNSIKLDVANLHCTFQNAIRPIVYGNYRNLGAHGFTGTNDKNLLDGVTYTIAANAVVTAFAVMYNKAVAIDNSMASLFERDVSSVSTKYPALLSLLIQTLGPYKTSTLPYKCFFVPYIKYSDTRSLFSNQSYSSEYNIAFASAMERSRKVCMTDVDIKSTDSTPWWMLHRSFKDETDNANANQTVFSPTEFQNRTASVTLGAVCLHDTLYDFPGPLTTAQIGPFLYRGIPTDVSQIPDVPRTESSFVSHYPAHDFRFLVLRGPDAHTKDKPGYELTKADLYSFGLTQYDDEAVKDLDPEIQISEGDEEEFLPSKSKKRKPKRVTRRTVAEQSINGKDPVLHWNILICQVLYFDTVLFIDLPVNERKSIITEANSL